MMIGFTSKTFPEGFALSNRATGAARLDRVRWLMSVVQEQPNAKAILRQYLDREPTLEPPKASTDSPRSMACGLHPSSQRDNLEAIGMTSITPTSDCSSAGIG